MNKKELELFWHWKKKNTLVLWWADNNFNGDHGSQRYHLLCYNINLSENEMVQLATWVIEIIMSEQREVEIGANCALQIKD